MSDITIVIVNYNVAEEVLNCVKSIENIFIDVSYEIVLIDNNSSDRSDLSVLMDDSKIKIVSLNENIGFSGANNVGVRSSRSEFLLFLNPDTIIIEDFVSPIIEYVNSNSKIGACGPLLLNEDSSYQNSTGESIGILFELTEALGLIKISRYVERKLNSAKFKAKMPFKVGWVSGACLTIKKDLFIQIGGFDTRYFLNYEDIDLCKKIEDYGYHNIYFPNLKCIHLNLRSQKSDYEKLTLRRYLSRLVYANIHYGFIKGILVRFIHIIGLLLRLFFVNFLYKGTEHKQRKSGYLKSLAIYMKLQLHKG